MNDFSDTFTRLCLAREASPDDLRALGGEASRWLTYRRLVRARLGDAVTAAFPRTMELLGAATMHVLVADFLATAPPTTRYVRGIPGDFVAYIDTRPAAFDATARDLMAYELAVLDVTFAPDPDVSVVGDFSMQRPAALCPARRLLSLSHEVDLLPCDGVYAARPRRLCVYRSPHDHTVVTLVLSPLAWALLARLDAGDTMAEAFANAASVGGVALDAAVVGEFGNLVADVMERGLMLGSVAHAAD